ncbi:hypothetical protein FOS14_06620 [Skermania sp. ID1734]|uniref:hypothetical protein n=1 Tax=Skermania sp. ID1734 TaxID=2597516 RepID=UPI00117EEFFD|nr:hypothetical protein [Skermania sp. ID1734]TSE00694.1 hypothetical protein FOS14_06620 [Skermania sp. ID1734]
MGLSLVSEKRAVTAATPKRFVVAVIVVGTVATACSDRSNPPSDVSATSSQSTTVPSAFVGTWHAHEERLTIDGNGHGRETYSDRSSCPDAPMSGCGVTGIVDFTLTSFGRDTATGKVTASSNPKTPIGGAVTIKLLGEGQGLELTVAGGDSGFPFCNDKDDDHARHYYCGA